MSDVTVIDYLATAMISPVHGTDPDTIRTAVRQQTVATVEDFKRPCDEDLEAARQVVPLIAVGAARGSVKVCGSLGAMAGPVMQGILAGTSEIGGDRAPAATEAAIQGLLDGAAQISSGAENEVRHALRDTDEAYQQSIARTRAARAKAAR